VIIPMTSSDDWLLKGVLLAQFHYEACLLADSASCIYQATYPIHEGIATDQVYSIDEVTTNI
jgi:hypothetical protein